VSPALECVVFNDGSQSVSLENALVSRANVPKKGSVGTNADST
jgi:hypothetical protein